jgi:hypothetical protein
MQLDRTARWRIGKVGLCVGLLAMAIAIVFAMERWRPLIEPFVRILDALATRGRVAYDPSSYRIWEGVVLGVATVCGGIMIWTLSGQDPEHLLDTYLQTKLEAQTRDHTRGLED